MQDTPRLSIILPVFNAMPYLVDCVQSIINQTFSDFELVIVNDGSTDGSLQFLKQIKDNRVKLYSQGNHGLGFTLNRLVELSSSEYIARMDSDDICHKERIEKQYRYLEENKDVDLVGSNINFFFGTGIVKRRPFPLEHKQIVRVLERGRFAICHPSIMFRKNIFKKIGGYHIKSAGEDLDFLLRFSEVGNLSNIGDYLYNYRLLNNSLSFVKRSELDVGYRLALINHQQRLRGLNELDCEEFIKNYNIINRVSDKIDFLSEKIYRKSIFVRSKSFYFSNILLLVAAAMRPKTSFFIIKQKILCSNFWSNLVKSKKVMW